MIKDVKIGQPVYRYLGGIHVPMILKVTEITSDLIICRPWTFRKDTGFEVDPDLDWDGITRTGSVIYSQPRMN